MTFEEQSVSERTDLGTILPYPPIFYSSRDNIFLSPKQTEQVSIHYHNDDLVRLEPIENGDWIDLRAAENVTLKKGEAAVISLGVSMKLPDGYEAHVVPRSSTFKTWGVIQTNGVGIIDNSYCGTNDIWKMPVYATRNTEIHVNDRICQFRIVPKMPDVQFVHCEVLDAMNRGGFGSTGVD